jgi:NADH-quinone oxidoreductase subunit E
MERVRSKAQERQLPPELYIKLDEYIDSLKINPRSDRRKDSLIQVLHKAQDMFGYLPEELQKHIANRFYISHAEVSGVISFYNFFTTTPKGKVRINVCMGTACYVNGSEKVLEEFERVLGIKSGEVTPDGKFSIESIRCLGACGLAPVVMINDKVYGKVQVEKIRDILETYIVETSNEEVTSHE